MRFYPSFQYTSMCMAVQVIPVQFSILCDVLSYIVLSCILIHFQSVLCCNSRLTMCTLNYYGSELQ